MGEPGRRRISDAEQRRVQHARIKHDVHQGTLRALGLHSTVTEYELTQSGIRTLRLQTARSWNDYSGATQVAGLSSGLHANPQTAYVLRGSLGIDRDQIMRLHIAGD